MPRPAHLRTLPTPAPAAAASAELGEPRKSFLRMVSHELRTPLNSILGFSEILASELYGPLGAPQYKEYAQIIRGSGQKLLKLVNQVLEIARLQGEAMDFEARPEPLDVALDGVLGLLEDETRARGVTFVIADRGRLPSVLCDARGLRTVLLNLIQNALTYSPEGGAVHISATSSAGGLDIRIRDHGPGLDPADIPRLMIPFEQGEDALTRQAEGAGLGLPIADLTCRAMGGTLTLTSRPGEGVTALVRLPAA
jgi:signal transduction histidine kinase